METIMALSTEAIRQQSLNAYNQWRDQWREHAKKHSKFNMKPLSDFQNSGIGKAVLVIANGYSFERDVEIIKKYQDQVDILVCDKTLGHCLENGIKPTYCVVCDANVSYEDYMQKWEDQLDDIVLFSNVCGNPKWTHNGNWKDIYFFVNMDVLNSQDEFSELSKCQNFIPAGTNVSNAMCVFLTQSDQTGRKNYFGYDKILLSGFDYSWVKDGKYYAFSENGGGKANYMRHCFLVNKEGELTYTSNNLMFSAQWLEQYIKTFNLPVVQCSRGSILSLQKNGKLEEQMQYSFKTEDCGIVKKMLNAKEVLLHELAKIDGEFNRIGREHYLNYIATS
jgi:hypothetical protein